MNATPRIRPPAMAGRFYPNGAAELRRAVEAMLASVSPVPGPAPKAVIAPHAGYLYSGPVAASAFSRFAPDRDEITRIILIGPSHRMALRGLASVSVEAFATPLGNVPVDTLAVRQIVRDHQVQILDEAHALEHALEVELPFLQTVLHRFSIVPLLAGDASAELVAAVLGHLWGGRETRLVVSSDLSHYYESQVARRLDGQTARAIEQLNEEGVGQEQACGRVPIRGLILAARQRHLRATAVDLRNSGDTAGPRDQVVGYGAFLFLDRADPQ